MKKLFAFFNIFRRDIVTMLIAIKNPRTPLKLKGILALAVIYLVSPVDFLPDAIPLAGIVDDMVVVPAAVYGVMNLLPASVRSDSEAKAAAVFRHVPLVVACVTIFIGLWLLLIVFGIYSFVTWLF